jgi:hypothetical protein
MSVSTDRRRFMTGMAGFLAAPAIVRASSLMAVKPVPVLLPPVWIIHTPNATSAFMQMYLENLYYLQAQRGRFHHDWQDVRGFVGGDR